MASDDDDTIYVDVSVRADERSAEEATHKLRDKFKDAGKHISDALSSDIGQGLTDQLDSVLGGKVTDLADAAGAERRVPIGSGLSPR